MQTVLILKHLQDQQKLSLKTCSEVPLPLGEAELGAPPVPGLPSLEGWTFSSPKQ